MKIIPLFLAGLARTFLVPLTSVVWAEQEAIALGSYRFNVLAGAPGTKGYVDAIGAAARFDHPGGVAVDVAGNVYISEQDLGAIRKISPEGAVTTLAGMPGQPGSQDGTGFTARFNQPQGLAVDSLGNVYVADTGNLLIRKISPAGVVTTLARATGSVETDGAGNVYVVEKTYPELVIRKIKPDGTWAPLGIPIPMLSDESFYWPFQVRVDRAGNLYVLSAEGWDNTEVVKLTPNGDADYIVNKLPPPFARGDPRWWETRWALGMALDGVGNLYVKYDWGSIGVYSPDGAIEARHVAEDTSGYQWGGFGVDKFGRLLVVPNRFSDLEKQTVDEWAGTIVAGVFDPDATGVAILTQPHDNSAGCGNGVTFMVQATGARTLTYQWYLNATPIAGATSSAYYIRDVQDRDAGYYSVIVTDGAGSSVTSRKAKFVVDGRPSSETTPPSPSPIFTLQTAPRTVVVGDSLTLTAPASGMPPQPMQWQKNGQPIAGATDATFTLFSVRATDAGTYTVVTTHAHGHTSSAVVVVVTPSTVVAPAIARQPVSITVAPGSTATFNVSATDETTYQWCRDGQPIGGATNALLVIPRADSGDIGSYSVAITNSVGTTTSTAASLTISDEANFGHLTNLSVRVRITAGEPSFTVGTVIGGGTGGVKPLLVRAVGPSLTMLGVATPLADTKLELRASGVVIAENNDWGGDTVLRNAAASVGAFPLADDSKDAALFDSRLAARDYTIDVSGAGGTTGEVIAELYDASATFSVGMPRLINVSVLKRIDAGDSLTAGFVIGGRTARTVLVRAIGPGLTALNVPGILLDPQFALFDAAQIKIAENDNWGGDTELAMAGASVRAFAIADRGSKDAMLLVTLAPGSYTAQVSGGGGSVLVEVYDVP